MRTRFILESCWQKESNCACVAFIKALLLKFGFRRAFQKARKGKTLVITLKDGWSVAFTGKEIKQLNRRNGISFRRYADGKNRKAVKSMRSFMELCFAVLVRGIQLRGYKGKEYTAHEAIDLLTREGVDTTRFNELLGVRRSRAQMITKKNLARLKRAKGALIYNRGHISVADGGFYEDIGTAIPLDHEAPEILYGKATHWYTLK